MPNYSPIKHPLISGSFDNSGGQLPPGSSMEDKWASHRACGGSSNCHPSPATPHPPVDTGRLVCSPSLYSYILSPFSFGSSFFTS